MDADVFVVDYPNGVLPSLWMISRFPPVDANAFAVNPTKSFIVCVLQQWLCTKCCKTFPAAADLYQLILFFLKQLAFDFPYVNNGCIRSTLE